RVPLPLMRNPAVKRMRTLRDFPLKPPVTVTFELKPVAGVEPCRQLREPLDPFVAPGLKNDNKSGSVLGQFTEEVAAQPGYVGRGRFVLKEMDVVHESGRQSQVGAQ